MGEVKWTSEQLDAIQQKGRNILVAAAAGSGKTAVLVERIINKIINEKIDIDKMLVVTFTNAAASEMRQRIMDAIYKYLEQNPEDEHMRRQTILMGKSNICTIHAFCLEVIKNNFFEIEISPNFRIGNQAEIELLKQDILEEIFEEKYISGDEEFLKLINTYTNYKGDETLKTLILKIYKFICANPFPEEWLENQVEKFNLSNQLDKDFSNTIWGKLLLEKFKEDLYPCIANLKNIKKKLSKYPELDKFERTIENDIQNLEELDTNLDSWDKAYNIANVLKWTNWPRDSKVTLEQKEIAKEKRDNIKKKFNKLKDTILLYNSKTANEDINTVYETMIILKKLVLQFSNKYQEMKKEKNIVDFNDIEHFALQILVKKEGKNYKPTQVAINYMNKFDEIAIDEYQDSNLVQEYILNSIAKGNNIFMVGDVKQSIYKFRQARPELFLDKYNNYKLKKEEKGNLKIQLFKNFRSRKNILDITNLIFSNIMSKKLGDITYDENEYLNLGANYENPKDKTINYAGKTDCIVIDLKKQDEEDEEKENIEDMVLEAKLVAKEIQNLIKTKYQVYDKRIGYRDITYKDIVILLRATSVLAPVYEKELNNLKIPVFSDTGTQYLETTEIQTMLALLKIIDNPMQDIPLVCVLRSEIGKFTDNELIEIKLQSDKNGKKMYFYEKMLQVGKDGKSEISLKIIKFLEQLEEWRNKQKYLSLNELIWQIYLDTGYYHYVSLMPNGALRQANLRLLFEKAKEYESASFKGLFNFINFMDKIKTNNGDMDSAKLIGENENVVRIMSIHKSKGLEFPVVFLCSTAKKFNMQDVNDTILLHQDIGIGAKVIDYERKIEYNTLSKVAIANKIQEETISEEMRILYVALTRAKEKLIITGLSKDFEKDMQKKEELLTMHEQSNIHPSVLKNYKAYLDWIELVYLKNREEISNIMNLKVYPKEDLLNNWGKEQQEENQTKIIENDNQIKKDNKIIKILNWEYPNIEASKIPAKTSVTKIKEMENEDITILLEEKKEFTEENLKKPNFLNEEINITSARLGTIMHLCLKTINEKEEYTYEKLVKLTQELVENEIITKNEKEKININKLLAYTKSDLFKSLKKAKQVHKEQAFYINIPAKKIYEKAQNENILVQGIIDLYYIDENNNIILVDYKTDYVKNDEIELVNKYKQQLSIYKEALEEALQTKVDKIYIYSTYLEKSIEVKI